MDISIITPSFNSASTIQNCLVSVSEQRFPVEHILIDGGSTDKTLELARDFGRCLTNIISERDQGIYDAMNKGLSLSNGSVIGFLNADDFYTSSDVIENVMAVFEDQTIQACYADLLYVDYTNTHRIVRYWHSGSFNPRKFYWGWMPPHPTFFARRGVYEKYGAFRLDLGTAADYELMLRFLVKHRITIRYLPLTLVKMRTGGASNTSFIKRLQANRNDRLAWKVNDLKPYPWTTYFKPLRKIPQYFLHGHNS
jgi:glycosyltransferase